MPLKARYFFKERIFRTDAFNPNRERSFNGGSQRPNAFPPPHTVARCLPYQTPNEISEYAFDDPPLRKFVFFVIQAKKILLWVS